MIASDPRLIKIMQQTMVLARTTAGISKMELSYRVDTPTQNIHRLEAGVSIPSIPTLIAYGEAIGVPAWKLLRHAQRQLEKGEGL